MIKQTHSRDVHLSESQHKDKYICHDLVDLLTL